MIDRLQLFSNILTVNHIENIISHTFDNADKILSVLRIDRRLERAREVVLKA